MERYATDVLENWTPPETDTHPDDVERSYDDEGRPTTLGESLVNAGGAYLGAIEGAGGTWWRVKGGDATYAVVPKNVRSLSPAGAAWFKATRKRIARYTLPGDTTQKLAPLAAAVKAAPHHENPEPNPMHLRHGYTHKGYVAWKARDDAWTEAYRTRAHTFYATCNATGETILSFRCDQATARMVTEAYSLAGRPLTLRPA